MKTFYQVRYLSYKKRITANYAVFQNLNDAKKFLNTDLKAFDVLQDTMTIHNMKKEENIKLWNSYVIATSKEDFMQVLEG